MPTTLVIYNPTAGHGRVRKHWPVIAKTMSEAGIEFDVVKTSAPLEATKIAQKATIKYKTVIAIGGDGTVHEIVNGLLLASKEQETIKLGVIPLGNGDDFAKMIPPKTKIGGKVFGWQVAIDKIRRGQTMLMDVARMTESLSTPDNSIQAQYFMNGMDIGFGAQAALNFIKIPKFMSGMAAYMTAIMKTLINYHIPHVSIQIDEHEPFEKSTTMTAITNGRCFGSGFWVCPEAEVDDGLLDVMMADSIGRLGIMRLIPKITKGTYPY